MNKEISILIDRLLDRRVDSTSIISWAAPIPFFGDLKRSEVATVGLNPSNREYVDTDGEELNGPLRRFHTLRSLRLKNWKEIKPAHLKMINDLCINYFSGNPYDEWFKRLDFLISGTNRSYYFPVGKACHLDLIPFATSNKWATLSLREKRLLLDISKDTLGILVNASPVKTLILNGITVVETLKAISNIDFEKRRMPTWTLPRSVGEGIAGYSFRGKLSSIGGVHLNREVIVYGYNHNIQSSYGVTTKCLQSIRNWITLNSQ